MPNKRAAKMPKAVKSIEYVLLSFFLYAKYITRKDKAAITLEKKITNLIILFHFSFYRGQNEEDTYRIFLIISFQVSHGSQ